VTGPAQTTASQGQSALSVPDLVAKLRSGVVKIEVLTCDGGGQGTGIILSRRLVATVEHVIDGAAVITIKRAGKVLSTATVIGADPARDLALLRTSRPLDDYRLEFASRSPRLAEDVAALGFPLGLPLSVTRGSVSGLDRRILIDGINRRNLVQTDAALNQGNSGGPLIATAGGEVVGLVDAGLEQANGISWAVSSKVARPLLEAWKAAPQPLPMVSCGGVEPTLPPSPQPPPPPPAPPPPAPSPPQPPSGVGVPSVYTGRFTSVDRLDRCNATATYVYCSAGPSGKAVRLSVGQGAVDLGIRGSKDLGGPSMPEGTSFRTPDGNLICGSSSRGISCSDQTTGSSFVIGDYRVFVSNPSTHVPGGVRVPDHYSGFFTSVDRLERCYAVDAYATCTSGPSGQAVKLVAGEGAAYLGILGSADKGGPAMVEVTSFQTPSESITCGSSSRGITCTDGATGASFVIGDHYVRVINNGHEVRY
jgi:hypothetical protein